MTSASLLLHAFLHDDLSSFTSLLTSATFAASSSSKTVSTLITPADLNARDTFGRTLLHLIASSPKPTAAHFARVLLDTAPVSFLDIYAQDTENAWNALHRALYAGNIAVARMLLHLDATETLDFKRKVKGKAKAKVRDGGLMWVKDREGNTPFDLFAQTIRKSDIIHSTAAAAATETTTTGRAGGDEDEEEDEGDDINDDDDDVDMDNTHSSKLTTVKPATNLSGDQLFTFGSNKNFSLGLGDHDDRTFPERVSLIRPDHLLRRFYTDHQAMRLSQRGLGLDPSTVDIPDVDTVADIPTIIRTQPIIVQDVIMSKLSTAIITSDPESNLYMAGFGPGGRLGTGDEGTRFTFACITSGGLSSKRIIAVALGQDHSIAVTDRGDVFSWGTNKYGQLGYTLPSSTASDDAVVPMQLHPRQIFNPFKREVVLGAAASAVHSAVYTTSGLYTFGKNEGQLGFMDADARSLRCQVIPRKVGAALFTSPIKQVCAIERATTVLLENRDVWCFTHYGYSKIVFPLDSPASSFIRDSFLSTRYGKDVNRVVKVTAGGSTIVGLSSFGEVYAVTLPASKHDVASSGTLASPATPSGAASGVVAAGSGTGTGSGTGSTASPSTTNPAKCRNAIPPPTRVWSLKKSFMAARDVAVGQDGSIIISTESGSAWRREKRITKKTGPDSAAGDREYKFVRVPGLARVVAVRSNAFGAYAAVTRGSEVARNGIDMPEKKIWEDVTRLIPKGIFDAVRGLEAVSGALMTVRIGKDDADIEGGERTLMERCRECFAALEGEKQVIWVGVEGCDVKFPIHRFLFVARSSVLAGMLTKLSQTRDQSIPDLLRMETGVNGRVDLTFHEGIDFLAVFNLWVYIYTDKVYDIWLLLRLQNMSKGRRHFAIRVDVMRIASALGISGLERAARIQVPPSRRLHLDMEKGWSSDPRFFDDADIVIELDGGAEVQAHSALLIERSLFFKGMFHGMSRGQWLALRRQEIGGVIRIDLRHIDPSIFKFVLRYIYVDADEELFDDVKCDTLDDLIDVIISVMAVANELMIDRLAQVCQKILGGYVTTRNVCPLTNIIGPCFVRAFKTAALEYMCVNLETMLEGKFLDDLDEDLIQELDHVCHESQLACQPVARGRNSEEFLFERFPELVPLIEENKQRRVDAMRLKSRLHEDERFRRSRIEKPDSAVPQSASKSDDTPTPTRPPALRSKQSVGDMMFEMEDEAVTLSTEPGTSLSQQQFISTPTSTLPWNFETPSRPRTDLSAIMAEASASNTTPQSVQSAQALPATPSSSTKLSQKERKKLQQQQMREMMMEEEEKAQFRSSPWRRQQQQQAASASATKQSPAQASPSAVASSPLDVKSPRPGQPRALSSKSGMTLRQTVAGGSKPRESPMLKSAAQQQQQQQQQQPASPSLSIARTVSQTQQHRGPVVNPNSPFAKQPIRPAPTPPRPGPSALSNGLGSPHGPLPSPSTPTTQTPLPIRSIRYDTDPTPAELALRQNSLTSSTPTRSSLAAILLEQQIEKDVIREAATAKHNLEEIQLEQEFQQWWDQESKRVQQQAESEAARASKRGSKVKSGKGRGGSHAADRGKGKGREEGEGEKSQHSENAGTGQKKKKGKQDAPSAPPAAAGNGSSHMQPQQQQQRQRQRQQEGSRHRDSRRGRPARGRGGSGAGGGHGARNNDRGHSQRPQGQINTQ